MHEMVVDTVTETVREIVMMATDAQETKDVHEKMIQGRGLTRAAATTRILVRFEDTEQSLDLWWVFRVFNLLFPFFNRGKRFLDAFRQGSIAPLLAFYNDFISTHNSWRLDTFHASHHTHGNSIPSRLISKSSWIGMVLHRNRAGYLANPRSSTWLYTRLFCSWEVRSEVGY